MAHNASQSILAFPFRRIVCCTNRSFDKKNMCFSGTKYETLNGNKSIIITPGKQLSRGEAQSA
jgi:hypothetical protein